MHVCEALNSEAVGGVKLTLEEVTTGITNTVQLIGWLLEGGIALSPR